MVTRIIALNFHGHSTARGAFSCAAPRFILDMCRRKPIKMVTTPSTNRPAAQALPASNAPLRAVNSL